MFRDPACSTFRKILIASVFGVVVFLIPNGVQSATSNSKTLEWAANQESDLAGYRVYHGTTSGNYGSPANAGKTNTYQYPNLESDKTHYFSITAYDSSGNESAPSPEVSSFVQPLAPPTLTSPNPNSTLEGSTVTFIWTPNTTQVTQWALEGGSASGVGDLFNDAGTLGTKTTFTATGLPTDGRTIYIQLWYLTANQWKVIEYQLTAAGSSTSSFPLTITKNGDGTGTITSNPGNLNCGSTCTANFSSDSPVTLSANAASDSIFSGWSGGGCSGINSCTMTLSSSQLVTAIFNKKPAASFPLTITKSGDGTGTITSNPGDLNCGSTCTANFSSDSPVTLSANAASDSIFSGWSGGGCSGISSCPMTLSSSQMVTATFIKKPAGVAPPTLTSPNQNSTLEGSTATFIWTPNTTQVTQWALEGGSASGVGDLFNDAGTLGTKTTFTATGLPTDGRTIYIQLWYLTANQWKVINYQFTAFASSSPPPGPMVKVNFQPRKASVPSGYLKDYGRAYTSSRGYGWGPKIGGLRERRKESDQRLDTFVFVSRYNTATWRYDLPNGDYKVSLTSGDPDWAHTQRVIVEGQVVFDNYTSAKNSYLTITDLPVTITDGTLTITLGGNRGASLLNYIKVRPADEKSGGTMPR